MEKGLLFWILFLLFTIFCAWASWPFALPASGFTLFVWLMFLVLGWGQYGAPIK